MAPRLRDAAALTLASLLPLAMAYLYFVVLNRPGGEPNPALKAAYWLGKAIQFTFPAVYVWCVDRSQFRFARPTWRGIPLGLGFGLLVLAGMFGLYFGALRHMPAFAANAPEMIHSRLMQFGLDSPRGFLLMALIICIPHSLAEEYYWRWFVYGFMRRHLSIAPAMTLSALGFMLHHVVILGVYFPEHFWSLAMPFSLAVAVGGAYWAWLYERSASLYAAWAGHAIIDAAIMAVGFVMLERYWN